MVEAFEKVSGKKVPYKITQRRPGDVAVCFADNDESKRALARSCLWIRTCTDSWRWQSENKNGYQKVIN